MVLQSQPRAWLLFCDQWSLFWTASGAKSVFGADADDIFCSGRSRVIPDAAKVVCCQVVERVPLLPLAVQSEETCCPVSGMILQSDGLDGVIVRVMNVDDAADGDSFPV